MGGIFETSIVGTAAFVNPVAEPFAVGEGVSESDLTALTPAESLEQVVLGSALLQHQGLPTLFPLGRYQTVDGINLSQACGNSSVFAVRDNQFGAVPLFILKLEKESNGVFGEEDRLVREMMLNEWNIGREVASLPTKIFRRVVRAHRTEGGRIVLILEHVAGEKTSKIISDKGPLSVRGGVTIAVTILEGLQALHQHDGGIVHLDLQPDNILITERGEVKVIDFGIAKRMQDISKVDPCNNRGRLGYAAPEAYLRLGLGHQRRRSDLFSLATCLYEWLTGQKAFPNTLKLPYAYDQLPSPIWKYIPSEPGSIQKEALLELNDIIFNGMRYKVGDRYRSAKQFKEALRVWQRKYGHLDYSRPL